jgi:hypothetical protein
LWWDGGNAWDILHGTAFGGCGKRKRPWETYEGMEGMVRDVIGDLMFSHQDAFLLNE